VQISKEQRIVTALPTTQRLAAVLGEIGRIAELSELSPNDLLVNLIIFSHQDQLALSDRHRLHHRLTSQGIPIDDDEAIGFGSGITPSARPDNHQYHALGPIGAGAHSSQPLGRSGRLVAAIDDPDCQRWSVSTRPLASGCQIDYARDRSRVGRKISLK